MILTDGRLARAWRVLCGREPAQFPALVTALRDEAERTVAERDAQCRRALVTAACRARASERPEPAEFEVCGCRVVVLPPEGE